jgi:hypothetical protein
MGCHRPKGHTKYALTGIGTGMEEYPKKGLSGYENAVLGGYYYRNRKKSLASFGRYYLRCSATHLDHQFQKTTSRKHRKEMGLK